MVVGRFPATVKVAISFGSVRPNHRDHLQDGAPDHLVNFYQGQDGGSPSSEAGRLGGEICNRSERPITPAAITYERSSPQPARNH